jgi:hypothetical protein
MSQQMHPMMNPFPVFPQVNYKPYPDMDRLFALEQRTFILEQELLQERQFKEHAENKIAELEEQVRQSAFRIERLEDFTDIALSEDADDITQDRLNDMEESNRQLVLRVEEMNDDLVSRINAVKEKGKKYHRKQSRNLDRITDTLQCYDDLSVKVDKITATLEGELECDLAEKVSLLEHSVMMLQIELGMLKCRTMIAEKEMEEIETMEDMGETEIEETMEDMVSSIVDERLPIAPGLYETIFPSL